MGVVLDIEGELKGQGLTSRSWQGVLDTVRKRLGPADWEKFSRLHRNFVAYRSETTLSRFYGFVFSQGLHLEINGFRHNRLSAILGDLSREAVPGLSILDIGAGAGILASALRRHFAPKSLMLQDPCDAARAELMAQGFSVLPHPAPAAPSGAGFELLICADSLGEINSDDDGLLANPDGVDPALLPEVLEQRFGFAQKLRPWKAYLAPGGRLLLWEPFAYQGIWDALSRSLSASGWETRLETPAPGHSYLELRPI